jgi:hypothetical protein
MHVDSITKTSFIMKTIYKIILINAILLSGVSMAVGQHLSDANFIINYKPIENSLALLQKLKPVTFEYQPETARQMQLKSGPQMGFLPSEIKTVFPGLIKKTGKLVPSGKNSNQVLTMETVDVNMLIPVLVKAVQQQEETINALKIEIDNLKKDTAK